MPIGKYNYRLSCVGLDDNEHETRLRFYVYGADSMEKAREKVRSNATYRRQMRQANIDWKTTELPAVPITTEGEITEANRLKELQIMMEENAQLEELMASRKRRPYIFGEGEL